MVPLGPWPLQVQLLWTNYCKLPQGHGPPLRAPLLFFAPDFINLCSCAAEATMVPIFSVFELIIKC